MIILPRGLSVETLPKMLKEVAEKYPQIAAQYSKDSKGQFQPTSFSEMYDIALNFGAGLLSIGVSRGDHIGLISDNRKEWQQSDMGIMAIGAIDVPRGCDASEKDLSYILSFAECKTVIVENSAQITKIVGLQKTIPTLAHLICFESLKEENKNLCESANLTLMSYEEVLSKGINYRKENPLVVEKELDKGKREDLACIIFTSGTTGEPKGVMLQHSNFIVQLEDLPSRIYLKPGDKALCVLPVWHAFQRLCEYMILVQASAICYSKPVGSIMLADFVKLNPRLMPAVPRVFEAVYEGVMRSMRKTGGVVNALFKFFLAVSLLQCKIDRILFRKIARFKKDHLILNWIFLFLPWILLLSLKKLGNVLVFKKIQAKLGNNFLGGVSGGGALPPAVDEFFWAVGINIVEGYGLTETAPVISVRPFHAPIFGTVGKPIAGVEVRIVGEDGSVLPPGKKGAVQVRGGIVMKGYYKKPELTAKAIDSQGWFNTGDLGMLTIDGEIVLRGRIKDTIVLRGGENVEPLPIEMKLNESRYISQSVILGQDQRFLVALIVPEKEEVLSYAKECNIEGDSFEALIKKDEIKKMFENEINGLVSGKNGFKTFERIVRFALLPTPFEIGIHLSAKQEIMRYKMPDLYAKELKELFK